jgi:hypothetical protein
MEGKCEEIERWIEVDDGISIGIDMDSIGGRTSGDEY